MAIKHNKVATLADEVGAEVNKTEWNADHTIETGTITNDHLAGSIDKAKITNTAVTLSDTQTISAKTLSGFTMTDATDIVLGSTVGTKIGTATTQLLGFYNKAPVDQPSLVSDPSGGLVIDAEARTAIIAIKAVLQELGLMA